MHYHVHHIMGHDVNSHFDFLMGIFSSFGKTHMVYQQLSMHILLRLPHLSMTQDQCKIVFICDINNIVHIKKNDITQLDISSHIALAVPKINYA